MDPNLKRSIILEHYQNPLHRGFCHEPGYQVVDMNNESCIDEVHLEVKLEDGKVADIHFEGEACAICTSSTSVMIEVLTDKSVLDAQMIVNQFENMLDEKEYDASILEHAIVYDDIAFQPNRKKCALLPWWGMKKVLQKEEGSSFEKI